MVNTPTKLDITKKQLQVAHSYTQQIITDLPDRAVMELLGGSEGDIDTLLIEMYGQVADALNIGKTLDTEKLEYLDNLEISMDMQLKKLSYNYFKTTVLHNFRQEWRNLEFGNLIQLYPHTCILAARGHGKCEDPETEVVMFDGTFKKIKDIVVGDKVMGIDSTPRNVLMIHSGIDDMYEVCQKRGEPYIVNSKHEIFFKHKDKKGNFSNIKLPAEDFHKKSNFYKNYSYGVKVNGWDLKQVNLPLEPYFLGIWLAEGHKRSQEITNPDIEVIEYLENYSNRLNLTFRTNGIRHSISGKNGKKNILTDNLKKLNLINNKHIPKEYLISSREQRLQLLAGLIDGDGTLNSKSKKSFVFSQKDICMIESVQELCWSLGFRASILKIEQINNFSKGNVFVSYQLCISGDTWNIPTKIKRKKIQKFKRNFDYNKTTIQTKKLGIGKYVGITLDGDNLYLGKDGTIKKNSFETCYSLPLWRFYSYDRPSYFQVDSIDNHNRKETLMITNVEKLATEHLAKIIDEIKYNDIIADKVNRGKTANLAATKIVCESGAILYAAGFQGFNRGRHCGCIVLDDCVNESSLYSQEQREKAKERFYGTISPILEPGGLFVVSGTPYASNDIYGELRNDPSFKVFEYPAVMPNGSLLSPDRFTIQKLDDIRKSVGSIIFSREYLVTPITSDSSIFPREFLERSTFGMENISLANSIHEFPFKLKKVVIGCDFAISGTVGADYSCFVVMGMDNDENYYLIDVWRKQSSSFEEQVNQIVSMDSRYKPNTIILEKNGFQKIMGDLVKKKGVRNVKDFTTTSDVKKDSYQGLPSLSAIFERYQLKIPYAEGRSREMAETIFAEFGGIGYVEEKGKLENTNGHDDIAMAMFFAITTLRENTKKFRVHLI